MLEKMGRQQFVKKNRLRAERNLFVFFPSKKKKDMVHLHMAVLIRHLFLFICFLKAHKDNSWKRSFLAVELHRHCSAQFFGALSFVQCYLRQLNDIAL